MCGSCFLWNLAVVLNDYLVIDAVQNFLYCKVRVCWGTFLLSWFGVIIFCYCCSSCVNTAEFFSLGEAGCNFICKIAKELSTKTKILFY